MRIFGAFFLILLISVNSVFSDVKEEQIQIAFTSSVDSIVGFSISEVQTISKVNDISGTEKEMHYDSNTRAYTLREKLYAFAQIFTTAPVRVQLELTPFIPSSNSDSEVSLNWQTSNAISVYENGQYVSRQISSDDGPITLFQDGVSNKPRVKSWQILPVLLATEVNDKAGTISDFRASIVVSLYAQ